VLLLCAVGVFWALPVPARRWFVLAASIAFYATWSPAFVLVPIALCIGVFLMARKIASGSHAGAWYRGAIAYTLAFLVVFRYHKMFGAGLDWLGHSLRAAPGKTMFWAVVPVGISFYTFEAISYLIDVRQGRAKPTRFSDLFLFVMFWPHIVAGPIVRFRELVPQLSFEKKFELSMLISGLDRLIWGLVQKNLLADSLSRFVDEGFLAQATGANTSLDNWFLAIAFGLQIYFDFAAYSNMAIGAAKMIGVTLPENFRFPYHAKNPSDFWQRWHMTLSRWVRDYLFFPINVRYQGAPLPLYLSLVGIMAVVGLWHGAGAGFVIWGVMQGCYLVAYHIWESAQQRKTPAAKPGRVTRFVWQAGTLIAVMAAWVPFRATSLRQAIEMLRSMFFSFSPRISFSLDFYLVTMLVGAVCVLEPYVRDWFCKLDAVIEQHAVLVAVNAYLLRPLLYALGLLLFLMFNEREVQFIYFQF
jgi:D-alanyl-lipoteichoic acid acyltransferase DltB (MBOAT superfamily)